MTDRASIPCEDYDVLELLCVDHARIELTLDDGPIIGTARTLESDGSAEYLIVRRADDEDARLRIDRIGRVVVRSRPARFEAHDFGTASRHRAVITPRSTG